MAYTLSNKCAKNICKRTVLLQLIIKNVVTCFLEHSVEDTSGKRKIDEPVIPKKKTFFKPANKVASE